MVILYHLKLEYEQALTLFSLHSTDNITGAPKEVIDTMLSMFNNNVLINMFRVLHDKHILLFLQAYMRAYLRVQKEPTWGDFLPCSALLGKHPEIRENVKY